MSLTTITPTQIVSPPSTTGRYYRPELDVLRFLAFLLVFVSHRQELAPIEKTLHPWSYTLTLMGILGVPVFFLLSAFLITELLTREQDQTGTIHLKAFYTRRILRIWPLYFAAFFGLAALTRLIPHVGATTPGSWLAFSLFSGNWYISKYGWLDAYPANPFWSISVEEQFYIVIPIIALIGRRRGLMTICLTLLVLAYIASALYARHPQPDFSPQWTNSFVQFQFFAVGTLLSLILGGRLPRWHPILRALILSTAIGCWLIAFLKLRGAADNPYPVSPIGSIFWWLFVLAGVLLLFLGFLGTPAQFLPRFAIYFGRISYGLYIFHAFFLYLVFRIAPSTFIHGTSPHPSHLHNLLATVIALGLTLLMAMLSYHAFEKPFLRLKRRFTFVPSRDA